MKGVERFDSWVSETALSPDDAELDEGSMRVIEYMLSCAQLEEIDLDSFTLEQAIHALEHISWFASADEGDDEAVANRNNMLTQINRIAHIRQVVDSIRLPKKSFF